MCVTVSGSQMFSFMLTNTSASQQPLHDNVGSPSIDTKDTFILRSIVSLMFCTAMLMSSVQPASHTDTNESIHLLVIPGSPTACCWLWVSGGTPRRLGRPTWKAVCLLGLRCFQDCLDELQQLGGRNLPVDATLVKFDARLHCSFPHHHL